MPTQRVPSESAGNAVLPPEDGGATKLAAQTQIDTALVPDFEAALDA